MNELNYREVVVPTTEEIEAQKSEQRRLLAETAARIHEQQNQQYQQQQLQQQQQQMNMNFNMGF